MLVFAKCANRRNWEEKINVSSQIYDTALQYFFYLQTGCVKKAHRHLLQPYHWPVMEVGVIDDPLEAFSWNVEKNLKTVLGAFKASIT